ncbi:hypothetical protein GE09DRAFT_1115127 [Coniochaeta sp. 2T2.1]|nr:hypothetical protein GE09DRAFT_1115127 [Coniochaeta sp. 2T2.1]
MAVAGAIRTSRPGAAAVGLWQSTWRAGERIQWQQHVRRIAAIDRHTMDRQRKAGERRMARTQRGGAESDHNPLRTQILLPMTWVRPPLSRFPRSWDYLKAYITTKARDLATRIGIEFSSKPTFFKKRLYKAHTRKLVPLAKALHINMYEAVAKGDKATLRTVCGTAMADSFVRLIESRLPGRKYGWELVRYNWKAWGYPRVVDHKLIPSAGDPMNPYKPGDIIRQVVVAIASRQRRVEYEFTRESKEWREVPGSEKEVDVVENVVLNQALDRRTFAPLGEWKIISLVGEMTPEKFREERDLLKLIEDRQAGEMEKRMGLK